jgi:hypothetical protein
MTDLEKVLAQAQYTALPLPREKSSPTTIYSFHEGQLLIVRDPHTCLPDPPLKITEDRAVDALQFQREFSFNLKGIVSFFVKIFSLGKAKAEFEAKKVSSATVVMGGLQHETIQTGELIDFLIKTQPNSCVRDVTDKNNFTVVAALKAANFTYTFKNSKGVTINLTLPEAESLFKTDASVSVSLTTDGKVVVNASRYVGIVSWKGDKIAKELDKAKRFAERPTALVGYHAPASFALAATLADIQRVRESTLAKESQRTKATPKPRSKVKSKAKSKPRNTRNR